MKEVENIRRKLGIDTRKCVFEISGKFLKISDQRLAEKVEAEIKRKKLPLKIKLLPDKTVGSLKYGICNVGTASVFKQPDMRSEQTTQIILGETFDVLEIQHNDWVRIRLHFDGYIGWVHRPQVVLMEESNFKQHLDRRKVWFLGDIGFVKFQPFDDSPNLRDVVACSALNFLESKDGWCKVELPDGTNGWVRENLIGEIPSVDNASADGIISTALRFLGVSYLWGGKTPKGFDCSGFVQTVFRLNGINLPRDANQQWEVGKDVGKNLKKLEKGDLMFFGSDDKNITHVGILIGSNAEIIHSSSFVRINSLEKDKPNYSERLAKTFVGARRILSK